MGEIRLGLTALSSSRIVVHAYLVYAQADRLKRHCHKAVD